MVVVLILLRRPRPDPCTLGLGDSGTDITIPNTAIYHGELESSIISILTDSEFSKSVRVSGCRGSKMRLLTWVTVICLFRGYGAVCRLLMLTINV